MPYKCKIQAAKNKRKYYLDHKEKMDAYLKEYYKNHRQRKIDIAVQWDRNNRDSANKRVREWVYKYPEKRKSTFLKNEYGITLNDYNEIFDKQNKCCAICKSIEPGKNRKYFCVDHCHSSNKVRGLLCDRCNKGLGYFKDNIQLFNDAIGYLSLYS